MAVGGSGGHFSPEYFDFVLISDFPESLRKKIVRLYHHSAAGPVRRLMLSNFVTWHREWNDQLGIVELDREMKVLQSKLAALQTQIIEGRSIRLSF